MGGGLSQDGVNYCKFQFIIVMLLHVETFSCKFRLSKSLSRNKSKAVEASLSTFFIISFSMSDVKKDVVTLQKSASESLFHEENPDSDEVEMQETGGAAEKKIEPAKAPTEEDFDFIKTFGVIHENITNLDGYRAFLCR